MSLSTYMCMYVRLRFCISSFEGLYQSSGKDSLWYWGAAILLQLRKYFGILYKRKVSELFKNHLHSIWETSCKGWELFLAWKLEIQREYNVWCLINSFTQAVVTAKLFSVFSVFFALLRWVYVGQTNCYTRSYSWSFIYPHFKNILFVDKSLMFIKFQNFIHIFLKGKKPQSFNLSPPSFEATKMFYGNLKVLWVQSFYLFCKWGGWGRCSGFKLKIDQTSFE